MMGGKENYERYIEKLEEERRKIHVFARELPLCLELVTQAIEMGKQQMVAQSQCSEQTASDEGPVLEEFIPIKRSSSDNDIVENDDDVDDEKMSRESVDDDEKDENLSKKSDWLRSVQLWNQTPDPSTKQPSPKKVPVVELTRNGGGAFHPFKREKISDSTMTAKSPSSLPVTAAASSTGESGGCSGGGGNSGKKDEKDGPRKARRCWSPELHRRFLQALQQLGGSHVATPKQIRELMKVDGLTNDEVKSHLQKYRLHARRPTPSIQNNNNTQPPQFVVVGGIWVPPPEYGVATATTVSGEASEVSVPNRIYAPIAAPPPVQNPQRKKSKQFHLEGHGNLSTAGGRCSSPATSSSTHTSPASPAC